MISRIYLLSWRYYRCLTLLLIFLAFVAGAMEGISIAGVVPLIDAVLGEGDLESRGIIGKGFNALFSIIGVELNALNVLLLLFIIVSGRALLRVAHAVVLRYVQTAIEVDQKLKLYDGVVDVSWHYLQQKNFSTIIDAMTLQSRLMAQLFQYFSRLVVAVINITILFFVLFFVSWKTTVILGLIVVVIYLILLPAFGKAKAWGKSVAASQANMQENANDLLLGYKTIKANVKETFFRARLEKFLARYKRLQIRLSALESLLQFLFEPLILLIVILTYVLFDFELAIFVPFILALTRMYISLQQLQNSHYKMASQYGSMTVCSNLLNEFSNNKTQVTSNGREFEQLEAALQFDSVEFQYGEEEQAFKYGPVSLRIPANKTTALVGQSGSGKSTTVDLMTGFLVPAQGEITIDGWVISEWNLSSIRRRVAYVSQDSFLFNDTVAHNITLGEQGYSQDAIEDACLKAHALEFIEQMPEGFETVLGANGVRLSGGQRQRIALARVFLTRPSVVILDEATSSLDNESERLVKNALRSLGEVMTVIVIAHRLNSIQDADIIYYFENGKVVESGNFHELMEQRRLFYKLYTALN